MKEIPVYKFMKDKYHKELLMDLVGLSFIRPWLQKTPVHRDNFYRIIFITGGNGNVSVEGRRSELATGDIICSRPGDIWEWHLENDTLDGYVLLFEEAFLLSFFTDTRFLERLPISQNKPMPFLHASPPLAGRLVQLFTYTKDEIGLRDKSDPHFLRAMTYAILTLIGRADLKHGATISVDMAVERHIDKFVRLVNTYFASEHDTGFYAGKLCVTPNYLNKIVKRTFDTNAKAYISEKIMSEARKLLTYTSLSVAEIAALLNFGSATYFNRFFLSHSSMTPRQFRHSPEK